MAKGMDIGTIGLLAAGGYGVLAYSKGMWPFNAPSAPVTTTPTNYVPAPTPAPKPTTTPSTTPATQPTGPAVGTLSIVNGATYQWNGSAWTLVKAAPQPQACPTGYHRQVSADPTSACLPDVAGKLPTNCDTNTPGWALDTNGNCVPIPAADTRTVSQKMVAAAGMSTGLSTDEWCYYYSQVTGNDCPVDPGSITYDSGDRTSPIDIGTWLGLMNQSGAGLSGLGDVSAVSPWLIAAGIAALMFMGGR